MTLKMNRQTGHYEAQASVKFWISLAAVACTAATALVTYAVTLTLAFSSVRADIKLLDQKMDLQQKALEARIGAVEVQINAVAALAAAVQSNTEALRAVRAAGRNGGQQ